MGNDQFRSVPDVEDGPDEPTSAGQAIDHAEREVKAEHMDRSELDRLYEEMMDEG